MTRAVPEAIVSAELHVAWALSNAPDVAERLLPGLDDVVEGRVRATNAARTHASHLARILRSARKIADILDTETVYQLKEKEN